MDFLEEAIKRLKKPSDEPLYRRIAGIVMEMTENGSFKADERLPAIRSLAKKLNVNNSTVVNAYKFLESKKVVYSVHGSGTYISEMGADGRRELIIPQNRRERSFEIEDAVNFAASNTSLSLFPVDEFKLLFTEILERDGGAAFDYQPGQGYAPLREAVCRYAESCGIKTGSDKIQIISGAQQGVDIVSKGVLTPGDAVFVENPTYYGAVAAFLSRGAEVLPAPVLSDGIDTDYLESRIKVYRPKLLYVMTYYQTPTCATYSLEKKRRLLELAYLYDFHIIEEDSLSDFNFSNTQVTSLKALDYKNKVIYIKSFSKILMPGLRLGFMILPKSIMESVKSAKYVSDIETSGFVQRAFELFLTGGGFDRHVGKMLKVYRKRYDVMKEASALNLKGKLEYKEPGGGLSFWYKCPNGVDCAAFCEKLLNNKVIAAPESLFLLKEETGNHFRLSFASLGEKEIKEGIKIIGELVLAKR